MKENLIDEELIANDIKNDNIINDENDKNSGMTPEQVKYIYNTLDTLEEKLQFLVDFRVMYYAKKDFDDYERLHKKVINIDDVDVIRGEKNNEEWEKQDNLFEELHAAFIKEYISSADTSLHKKYFEKISEITFQNNIDMMEEYKVNYKKLNELDPEKNPGQNKTAKKAYYLSRNTSKSAILIGVLNEINTPITSEMTSNSNIKKVALGDVKIDHNTTMKDFATHMGYEGEEIDNYLERAGANEDDTVIETFRKKKTTKASPYPSNEIIEDAISAEIIVERAVTWTNESAKKAFEVKKLSEEDKKLFAEINNKNKKEVNARDINDWIEDEYKEIAVDLANENNRQVVQAFNQKYADKLNDYKKVKDVNDLSLMFNKFNSFKELILAELNEFRAQLILTQANPEANFFYDEVSKKTPEEGSREYKEMADSIREAITIFSSDNDSIEKLVAAVGKVSKKAQDYHSAKEGLFGGPRTDNGILRYNISDDISKRAAALCETFEADYYDFQKKSADFGVDFNNKTAFGEISRLTEEYITDKAGDTKLMDVKNDADKYANDVRFSVDRAMVYYKLSDIKAFDDANPLGFKPRPTTNVTDAAKNYIVQSYIDICENSNVTSDDLRNMQARITGKELDKLIEKYTNNKMFQDLVKKNPKGVFSKWRAIEKGSNYLLKSAEQTQLDIYSKYDGMDSYVLKHNLSYTLNDRVNKNVAEILESYLLSDPANETLRNGLATSLDKQRDFKKYLEGVAKKGLSKKFLELSAKKSEEMDKYKDLPKNDPVLKKKIAENFGVPRFETLFEDKMFNATVIMGFSRQQKAKAVRQQNAQKNVNKNANKKADDIVDNILNENVKKGKGMGGMN